MKSIDELIKLLQENSSNATIYSNDIIQWFKYYLAEKKSHDGDISDLLYEIRTLNEEVEFLNRQLCV